VRGGVPSRWATNPCRRRPRAPICPASPKRPPSSRDRPSVDRHHAERDAPAHDPPPAAAGLHGSKGAARGGERRGRGGRTNWQGTHAFRLVVLSVSAPAVVPRGRARRPHRFPPLVLPRTHGCVQPSPYTFASDVQDLLTFTYTFTTSLTCPRLRSVRLGRLCV